MGTWARVIAVVVLLPILGVLDKTLFEGVLVSDDALVYQNFSKAQKCWAHLLRKAIKLTLRERFALPPAVVLERVAGG